MEQGLLVVRPQIVTPRTRGAGSTGGRGVCASELIFDVLLVILLYLTILKNKKSFLINLFSMQIKMNFN
jgi:hypothetical protein